VLLAPHEWKGSIPKAHHHRRILACLDPAEHAIAHDAAQAAGAHAKEVLDAVGLLVYYMGRTGRSGGERR
jgi:DNA primase